MLDRVRYLSASATSSSPGVILKWRWTDAPRTIPAAAIAVGSEPLSQTSAKGSSEDLRPRLDDRSTPSSSDEPIANGLFHDGGDHFYLSSGRSQMTTSWD